MSQLIPIQCCNLLRSQTHLELVTWDPQSKRCSRKPWHVFLIRKTSASPRSNCAVLARADLTKAQTRTTFTCFSQRLGSLRTMLPLPAALSIAVLISAVACLQKVWTTNATVGMIANTTSGLIKGHANAQYPYVSEYLGVPFAHPPLNNLRFMPPKAYAGCGKEVVADEQPPSCPQQRIAANYSQPLDFINHALADGTFANHTSEDCLYLNVWTKFPCVGAPLKPVLVWINGGGFHSGGVGDDSEQGAIFAEQQDVVLVSFNYRLGIFGFPGSPSTRQNLALLDQRVAVEWIQKNIMSFGGDAEKITIFGHSAGGASVDYYNYAWADDPIVAGSVIMSGNAFSFGNRYPNTSAEAWYTASTVLRCGNQTRSTDADIFSCMRTKSVAELLNATDVAGKYLGTKLDPLAARFLNTIGPFGPTIDNVTVFQNYTARGKEKDFIKRPILAGTNDDEGCLFAERGDIPVSAEDEFTTVVFTCPTYHAVQSRVDAGVPSWKYRFFGRYK